MNYNVEIHNSTIHDGNITLEKSDNFTIFTSERINRKRHSNDIDKLYSFFINNTNSKYSIDKRVLKYKPFQKIHHHLAHASCSFFCSPFKSSAIMIIDGMGPYRNNKFASTSLWIGEGCNLKLLYINSEPLFCYNSIGHFYSSITYYCGFWAWEEGKTMGLASLGEKSSIHNNMCGIVKLLPNGEYWINPDFIGFCFSLRYKDNPIFKKYRIHYEYYKKQYQSMFGPIRKRNSKIEINHKNLAWSAQNLLEKLVLHISEYLYNVTRQKKLCIGGGVGLNCVANSKLFKQGLFNEIFIPPNCGDDGQSLGKLLYKKHVIQKQKKSWCLTNAYLGPRYRFEQIVQSLRKYSDKIKYVKQTDSEFLKKVVRLIIDGNVIGFFQGRSEIGPRALGHRSILADPRDKSIKDYINSKIKHRENFRPFAPSILNEYKKDYFHIDNESPFMLFTAKAKPLAIKKIPSVVHFDNTSRIQTVTKQENGIFYDLISEFNKLTGVPVLLNTSFNDSGEPIVETPEDAINTFLNLELDALILDKFIIFKI